MVSPGANLEKIVPWIQYGEVLERSVIGPERRHRPMLSRSSPTLRHMYGIKERRLRSGMLAEVEKWIA
jgi:hypothetical protein